MNKPILRKLCGAPNNLGAHPFQDPVSHFGAPWRRPFDFAVGATLQAASECPRRSYAGILQGSPQISLAGSI